MPCSQWISASWSTRHLVPIRLPGNSPLLIARMMASMSTRSTEATSAAVRTRKFSVSASPAGAGATGVETAPCPSLGACRGPWTADESGVSVAPLALPADPGALSWSTDDACSLAGLPASPVCPVSAAPGMMSGAAENAGLPGTGVEGWGGAAGWSAASPPVVTADRRRITRTTSETVAAQAVSRLPTPCTNVASTASQPSARPAESQAEIRGCRRVPPLVPLPTARSCPTSRRRRGRQAEAGRLL